MERPVRFPWKTYQEVCLGALRWQPSEFWKATTWDVVRAFDGYAAAKGIKKPHDERLYPTKEEREELHRRIRERENGKRNR